jgi:uncharacterized protein YxeA
MKKLIVICILLIAVCIISLTSFIIKKLDDHNYERVKYSVNAGISREVDNTEDEDESDYKPNGIDDDQCSQETTSSVTPALYKA